MKNKKYHMCYQTLVYSPNGTRLYFGKHSSDKISDKYVGSGNYIYYAKRLKYRMEIIDRTFFDTEKLAYEFEELLIEEAWDKFGKGIRCMNMKPGGEGGSCTSKSPESVEKGASKIRGIPRSELTKKAISDGHKRNPYSHTEEAKKAMSLAKSGKKRTKEANEAHIGKHSQPRPSMRSKLWEFEKEIHELWIKEGMPKRRKFRHIIVENGFPDLDVAYMVKTFEKNLVNK